MTFEYRSLTADLNLTVMENCIFFNTVQGANKDVSSTGHGKSLFEYCSGTKDVSTERDGK
jgi:hypothetical protein